MNKYPEGSITELTVVKEATSGELKVIPVQP
jgi:hypothetical protein